MERNEPIRKRTIRWQNDNNKAASAHTKIHTPRLNYEIWKDAGEEQEKKKNFISKWTGAESLQHGICRAPRFKATLAPVQIHEFSASYSRCCFNFHFRANKYSDCHSTSTAQLIPLSYNSQEESCAAWETLLGLKWEERSVWFWYIHTTTINPSLSYVVLRNTTSLLDLPNSILSCEKSWSKFWQ